MNVPGRLLPLLVLLTACGQPLAPQAPLVPALATGLDAYRTAAASGTAVYAIDPGASLVAVTVRRGGLMARLGHDHVVASHTLTGYAAPGMGRADVSFRLDQLTIDEPQLLRDAGIGMSPSPEAVEGTRKNMLGPVLDAERYPVVTLHAELPAAVQVDAAQVTASGAARLKQTDFGITPFAVGAGLLAVQDEIAVSFNIVARRWTPPVK